MFISILHIMLMTIYFSDDEVHFGLNEPGFSVFNIRKSYTAKVFSLATFCVHEQV